jgi:hypothetical protein
LSSTLLLLPPPDKTENGTLEDTDFKGMSLMFRESSDIVKRNKDKTFLQSNLLVGRKTV